MKQIFHDIISGARRGVFACGARAGLSLLELPYRGVMKLRNRAFDRGWKPTLTLPRPSISVGNLTVGGTGKTPLVAWLATQLLMHNLRPAVLMRGYGAKAGEVGDEQQLLRQLLGAAVPVGADPDRSKGAGRVLASRVGPEVDVFVLDDAFQHRRVRREFDLVLIDATRPFGHGHVLPRGLLREPMSGLGRASAVLLTRCDLASDIGATIATIRRWTDAPLFRSSFGLSFVDAAAGPVNITNRQVVVACGIGNPEAFAAGVRRSGGNLVEMRAFADHHRFTPADVASILDHKPDGATVVVTGKDWTKLATLWPMDIDVAIARQTTKIIEGDELVGRILTQLNGVPRGEAKPASAGGFARDQHRA